MVALIIDERSMVSAKVFALMEHRFRLCMNNGQTADERWGRLPIVLTVGDDFQLPTIEKGMIYSFDSSCNKTLDETIGCQVFQELDKSEQILHSMLRKTRCEFNYDELTEQSKVKFS